MRLLFAVFLLLFADALATATEVKVIKLAITNPSETVRLSENIVVQVEALQTINRDFQPDSATVWAGNAATIGEDAKTRNRIELPSQVDDVNGDQKPDELVFQIDLQPKQTRIVTIAFGDPAKAAQTRNYPSRTNAKFTTKFEGLGWESDINAWRLYFDKRNAIDLFGKRRPGLSLETFGKPGHNYHEESPFGRDIYKIGNALGIGAIGALVDGKVVKVAEVNDRSWKIVISGPVRTIVELNYKGWQVAGRSVDLTSRMTVWAGERGFDHRIITRNAENLTLVTGLPRKPGLSEVSTTETNSNVQVVATWGHQVLMTGATATDSLPDQNLGLVVMLPSRGTTTSLPADADNLLLVVPSDEGGAHWYVSAAWDQENSENQPGSTTHIQETVTSKAITTRDDFVAYIKDLALRFTTPATVTILSKTAVSTRHPRL